MGQPQSKGGGVVPVVVRIREGQMVPREIDALTSQFGKTFEVGPKGAVVGLPAGARVKVMGVVRVVSGEESA